MAEGYKSPHSSTETAKEMAKRLPFKIDQVVEAKSFSQGYRGAWFECKIVEIDKGGRNQLRYKFKYMHFPEEPLHWSQAYQQRHRGQVDSTELMLRPLPPPILQEKDVRNASYNGIVVVPHAWEVGDLVNWWCDDVWWEAAVTEIKGNGKVKINLSKPPLGEGGVHVAEALELRPSLVWSNKDQWTIPISKKKANGKPAARIVELSSTRWLKISGPVRSLLLATPSLPVKVELIDQSRDSDGTHPDAKKVPSLEALRRAAEPLNTTQADHGEEALFTYSRREISRLDNCTSSGTLDEDLDDISNAMQLKRQQFKRHIRKFKWYRKHINRAVDLDRRRRFKKKHVRDCKVIDSSEESDGF
ncbi:unnamed protein product [Calypogeia fissa]